MPSQNQTSRHIAQAMKKLQRQDYSAGFGLTEVALAVAAGSLLITGGVIAMRSLSSSMQASGQVSGHDGLAAIALRNATQPAHDGVGRNSQGEPKLH